MSMRGPSRHDVARARDYLEGKGENTENMSHEQMLVRADIHECPFIGTTEHARNQSLLSSTCHFCGRHHG